MTGTLFEGTNLLLQDDLLHEPPEFGGHTTTPWKAELDHLASSIHQAFAANDYEGALLVIEINFEDADVPEIRQTSLDRVEELARKSIRRMTS